MSASRDSSALVFGLVLASLSFGAHAGEGAELIELPGVRLAEVSADGSSACGYMGADAVRWTRAAGLEIIPQPSGYAARGPRAYSISWDGRVVCGATSGTTPRIAWRWVEGVGTQALPDLEGTVDNGYAESVSANGQVVVYQSRDEGGLRTIRWTESEITVMPHEDGVTEAPIATNYDGSLILTLSAPGARRGFAMDLSASSRHSTARPFLCRTTSR